MNQPLARRLACRPSGGPTLSPAAARRGWRLRPRALALALAAGGVAPSLLPPGAGQALAQALPGGLQVVHGQASVATVGNQMTVTNSAGAILNWQSFSVGASQAVRFQQPDASSKVLNRVLGADPSNIQGRISSNGQVWLLNPYGVLFGANARVDVGSLVVSTLNLADTDWLKQNPVFNAGNAAGAATASIVNQGELRTVNGGRVILLAGAGGISNAGLISAPGGQVVLAAGKSVQLVDSGLPNLAVEVAAPAGQAVNLGQLLAAGGRIDVLAAMVNQQGIVRADAVQGRGGQVLLRGSDALTAAAGSTTSANGSAGGQVTLDAGGGTASIAGGVQADGSAGRGGQVQLLGQQVGLLDGAAVEASGAGGGGQVLAGGGAAGQDANVPNAQAVFMARGASIHADATEQGDGGHIVLWSDRATRAYGSLSARGGADGGNGGLVETSGGWLDAQPLAIDTKAPQGRAGTWLIDPYNIAIVDTGTDTTLQASSFSGGVSYAANGDNSLITTGTIATWLNQGLNVVVSTTPVPDYGLQAGDISMIGATLAVGPAANVTLTLDASRNIVLSGATIHQDPASSGTLNLVFSAANAGQGAISIDNSALSVVHGGNITLTGPSTTSGPNGVSPFAGAIGYNNNSSGVSINGSQLSSDTGAITLHGLSTAGTSLANTARGVSVTGSSLLAAGSLDIAGWVDTDASLDRYGVYLQAGSTLDATGAIRIDGTALSAANTPRAFQGVSLGGAVAATVGGTAGPMTITGLARGASPGGVSVFVGSTASIDASAASSLAITATDGQVSLGDPNVYSASPSLTLPSGGTAAIASNGSGTGSVLFSNYPSIYGAPSSFTVSATDVNGYAYFYNSGSDTFSANTLSLGGYLSGASALTLNATTFSSQYLNANVSGPLRINADTVTLGASTSLTSQATGNAIDINSLSFFNNAGPAALNVTGPGRWRVYALDQTPTNFTLGGLNYDATVYGSTPSSALNAGPYTNTGKLLVFSTAPSLTQSASGPISRIYDATTAISFAAGGPVSGLIDGDRIVGNFDTKDVGSNKPITLFPAAAAPDILDANGKPVYGYAVPSSFSLAGSITPFTVTVGGTQVLAKTYNADPTATLQGGTIQSAIAQALPADASSLTLTQAGRFSSTQAGTGIPVTALDTLGGPGVGNYTLVQPTGLTGTIAPAPLTVGGTTVASNKTYDGTVVAQLAGGVLSGTLYGGDVVGLSQTGTFATPNAGTHLAVTAADSLTGPAAGNYVLQGQPGGLFADINPALLTVTGTQVQTKTYDANATATLANGTLAGVLQGDLGSVTLTRQAGYYASANAGTGIAVMAADAIGGPASGNYTLVQPGGLTGTIDPAPLTLGGTTVASSKVYDGTTSAVLSGGVLLGTVYPVDNVGLRQTGTFASANVGSNLPVAESNTLTGPGAGNYVLQASSNDLVASITPATLTYVATPALAFSGSTLGPFSGSVTGFVGSDSLGSATTGNLVFTTSATSASPAGSYPIDGSGLAAVNYSFVQAPGNATALTLASPNVGPPSPPPPSGPPQPSQPPLPLPPEPVKVTSVLPPERVATAYQGRVIDAVQAVQTTPGGGTYFGSIDLSTLTGDALISLLEARSRYKREVFGVGIRLLEADPALADAPACETQDQLEAGVCIAGDALINSLQAQAGPEPVLPVPALPAIGVTAATPGAAPTPGPAEPALAGAPAAAPPVVVASLPVLA
ncbi:MAG: filamentous hemagglutinin N-terminal domain-containing protein, partial [Burkholderiales bacterium]|nr:filamentous hemagglutinin N-terminal domain-containing protein [Burkholderiales bacterium]